MNFKYNITTDDNFPQLQEALTDWVKRVLTIWGMKPQSLFRPAITEHLDEFREIAITEAEDS